jgi:hypothetical protein
MPRTGHGVRHRVHSCPNGLIDGYLVPIAGR